jgi:uncharacterized protein HemY
MGKFNSNYNSDISAEQVIIFNIIILFFILILANTSFGQGYKMDNWRSFNKGKMHK